MEEKENGWGDVTLQEKVEYEIEEDARPAAQEAKSEVAPEAPKKEEIKELGLDKPQPEDPDKLALRENIQMQTEDLMATIEKKDAETANNPIAIHINTLTFIDLSYQN